MSIPRICWRRSIQLQSAPCIRRRNQSTFRNPGSARRALEVPRLDNDEFITRNGIKGPNGRDLYTDFSLKIAWTDYQRRMLDRVNELTAESPLAGQEPKKVLIETARNPQMAALFNHASMAWNNHFFFDTISTRLSVPMPEKFREYLLYDFSSIETLKSELLATAYAMFGPGFVWLVRTRGVRGENRKFKILTTYLAGSPLPGAHNRRQPLDANTQNVQTVEAAGSMKNLSQMEYERQTQVQNLSTSARDRDPPTSFGGVDLEPLLCVNTWEHAWLFDFTVDGKWDYLNRWWDLINWDKVFARSGIEVERRQGQLGRGTAYSQSIFERGTSKGISL